MKRTIFAMAMALISFAFPANAFDVSAMTDAERTSFRAEIRAYLMENPEVLLEAIQVLEDRQASSQEDNDAALLAANADEIYNDGVSYVGGNPDGDITIVEFSDYRCGYCKKAHPEVKELLKSDGNIRIIYKEFPILGPDSLVTARFALAILLTKPEAYKAVNDALMTLRGTPSTDVLTALAEKVGADPEMIMAKMDTDEITSIIQANRALGQRMQISGTPSFIFGNQMVRGYVPLDAMRQLVKEERAKQN